MAIENPVTQGAGSAVVGAIRTAARATGTNFQYLLATAQVESGLDPNAAVASSSAKGLFQFIDQTWLTTLKEAGPALGYGRYADAIAKSPSGRYEVPDPEMRRKIFSLRDDPAANAAMAGAFTQQNAALLTDRIGRPPTEGELYVAHFLGASGAARLINRAGSNPNEAAAAVFPNAARANKSIFYDHQGQARSVAGVYRLLVGRYDVARATPSGPAAPAVAGNARHGDRPERAGTAGRCATVVQQPVQRGTVRTGLAIRQGLVDDPSRGGGGADGPSWKPTRISSSASRRIRPWIARRAGGARTGRAA